MSTFVVIDSNRNARIGENIIKKLPADAKKILFVSDEYQYKDENNPGIPMDPERLGVDGTSNLTVEFYPDSFTTHDTKLRNFISKWLLENKIGGMVHIIEENVRIKKDINPFVPEIEKMMKMFKLKSWFNTSCDMCNFVYTKYNPRMFIAIDEPEAKAKYDKTIAWCSNANTVWICYDLDTATFDDIRFEERFRFPMYYIIEFLARRRNTKTPGSLDYMNYYPSIPEELGVFETVELESSVQFSNEEIQAEDKIFREELKVDNHPDVSIDSLMLDMRNAILSN